MLQSVQWSENVQLPRSWIISSHCCNGWDESYFVLVMLKTSTKLYLELNDKPSSLYYWSLNWMKSGKVFSSTGNMMDNRVRQKLHMWFSIIWDKTRWWKLQTTQRYHHHHHDWVGYVGICWSMPGTESDSSVSQLERVQHSIAIILSQPLYLAFFYRTQVRFSSTLVVNVWLC